MCAFCRRKMVLENKNESADSFCTPLSQSNLEIRLQRKEANHKDLSAKFMSTKKNFKKQYAYIYACRLMKMKERIIESCSLKWGNAIPIRKLSELSDERSEKCIVIGTLFKSQKLKPSILKEISEEAQVVPQPVRSNYVSDNDILILEDEIQRIRLIGQFDTSKFVTGIVVGLLGIQNEEGKFEVDDMCFANVPVSPEKPLAVQDECYLVLLSGLNVSKAESLMASELLIDWIRGDLGSISEQENSAKICRVLIAGNSVAASASSDFTNLINTEVEKGLGILTDLNHLDNILRNLVSSVEVDLLPGEFDPSNHVLPQQPMYNCIFPKVSQYESFHSVTNPYECLLGGRRILGTSGQPIHDIRSLTDLDDSLDILEKTLFWAHLAPTAPDTLACYPYYDDDPFIITELPDIYFAGNQPEYGTKLVEMNVESTHSTFHHADIFNAGTSKYLTDNNSHGDVFLEIFTNIGHVVRLISIPSFSKKKTCVIVNLKTLECNPLTFLK